MPSRDLLVLFKGGQTLIRWRGMKRRDTGAFVNTATVAVSIKNAAGAQITGGGFNLTYETASNGNYSGTFTDAAVLSDDTNYWIELTATAAGLSGFRRCRARAEYAGVIG